MCPPILKIQGSLLARNTALNFIGQAVPLLVAVMTIPFIIRSLGIERFGLLSLAWVVLGYFAIFDLGLGRATTKFVAEALGKGEEDQVPRLVWTAVTIQAFFGLLGTIVLASITPLLVERVLNIPPELTKEAKDTFYLLSLSIPVVLICSSFRGVLEAAQRFDLVNAVRIPISTLTFLLPLFGLLLGFNLPGIVVLILVARFGSLAAFVVMSLRIVPQLRRYSGSFALLPRLFSFGGWVTVSSIVGPILVYLDRFLIGSLLSIVAVAYYSAPYEAVTRLWIISASLTMTLFPAFSALEEIKDKQRLGFLFTRSVKCILLALGPIILIIGLFAEDILQVWLGADFAAKSTVVLQILALGVLINSLAHIPFALLQGTGRPDLPAKFHLLQLPIYVGIAWFFISQWGIAGAAAAWTLRVALDALLLFGASGKIHQMNWRVFAENGFSRSVLAFLTLLGISLIMLLLNWPVLIKIGVIILMIPFFVWSVWHYVLDIVDRKSLTSTLRHLVGTVRLAR